MVKGCFLRVPSFDLYELLLDVSGLVSMCVLLGAWRVWEQLC